MWTRSARLWQQSSHKSEQRMKSGFWTFRRIAAELVGALAYRRVQRLYWDLRAKDFTKRYNFQDDHPILIEWIGRTGAKRVLDVGCGNGRCFDAFVAAGVPSVVALDLSPILVSKAKERGNGLARASGTAFEVRVADIRKVLPVNGEFDLIITNRVLQHIHPAEIQDVVRQLVSHCGGRFYINECMGSAPSLPYLFNHDYSRIFGTLGFALESSGRVPGIGYEYSVFKKHF